MASKKSSTQIVAIPLKSLTRNPVNPRTYFDDASIASLAQSIHDHGLMNPIVVSKTADGYTIVAGERRFRACQHLGLETIDAILTEGDTEELSLIENVQRQDLHPLDEADAYARLLQRPGYTQADVARLVGKDRTTITKLLKLNQLDDRIKQASRTSHAHVSKSLLLEIAHLPQKKQYAAWLNLNTGVPVRDARRITRSRSDPLPRITRPQLTAALRAGRGFLKQLTTIPPTELSVENANYRLLLKLYSEITSQMRALQDQAD